MIPKKKYVFLDRDGTINVKKSNGQSLEDWYVKTVEEFVFIPEAIQALKKFNDKDYNIIVITNQSVVGRGIISNKELDIINQYMISELIKFDIEILDIFTCTCHPEDNCYCRKPNPGLLIEASNKYNINLNNCYFIGDMESDILAGKKAGCKTILLNNKNLLEASEEVLTCNTT